MMCISLFSYGRPVVVRCMGGGRLGMCWVGSVIWWVGLGWVDENRGGSMVSGALDKISRLCLPLSDGPSDDGFQLTLSVSEFTYLINAFCSALSGAPLPWCPGQLPQSPTPRSTTG